MDTVEVIICVARSSSRRHFVCVFFLNFVSVFFLLGLLGLRFVGCACYSCSFSGDLAWHIYVPCQVTTKRTRINVIPASLIRKTEKK